MGQGAVVLSLHGSGSACLLAWTFSQCMGLCGGAQIEQYSHADGGGRSNCHATVIG